MLIKVPSSRYVSYNNKEERKFCPETSVCFDERCLMSKSES